MSVYLYVIFPLFIFSLLEFNGFNSFCSEKKLIFNKILFLYACITLCIIAAFRFQTGRDWSHYIFFFEHSLTREIPVEKGYMFVNKLFKQYTDSFYLQQFCINSFCSFCIFRLFYRESEYPLFTLLMYALLNYFFTTDMAQVRQHIAMAILCCGIKFIKERKILLWILIIVLAMQFHITAFLAFPLFYTNRIKISANTALVFLFVAIFITLFGYRLVRGIVEIVMLLPFIPKQLATTLQRYFTSKTEGQFLEMSSGLGYWGRYLFHIAMILLTYFGKQKYKQFNYYLFNFMIAVVLQSMARNFDQFARVANYYMICGCGLVAYNIFPDSTSFFKRINGIRLIFCSVFLLFTFLTFYTSWSGNYGKDYAPYRSFVFQEAQ